MDDTAPSSAPEVTIEPADNGFVVRHYQRSAKKDESGRTIRRVASTTDEALSHARTALGGTGKAKSAKKKSLRDGQLGTAGAGDGGAIASTSPAAHSSIKSARGSARRRRPRVGGRR